MKVLMNIAVAPSDNVMTEVEGNLLRVYFDFQKEEHKEDDAPDAPDQFSCQQVDVVGRRGYGDIVGAIMNDKYSPDDIQAIMFNHELAKDEDSDIAEEKRAEYVQEYNDLQNYRKHAKEIASLVLIDIA